MAAKYNYSTIVINLNDIMLPLRFCSKFRANCYDRSKNGILFVIIKLFNCYDVSICFKETITFSRQSFVIN